MNDLKVLNDLVILLARLTAARAGYLDELAAANIPLDIDRLIQAGIAASGTVVDVGAAAADFDTSLTEVTNNHYNGQLLMFITGVCAGQAHVIDVYTGGTKNVYFATSDQWTEAPGNGDAFVILPNPGAYLKKIHDEGLSSTIAGNLQMAATTVDLHNPAGFYNLFTGTNQKVVVEKLLITLPNIDVSDDVGGITGISIQTNHATPRIFITIVQGDKLNLHAQQELFYIGAISVDVGDLIQLTLAGGTADVNPTTCAVVAEYRAVIAGGTL